MDGPREIHDRIRRVGSYDEALSTIAFAAASGIAAKVTLTLTEPASRAFRSVYVALCNAGASEIVVHRLRLIGNAAKSGLEDVSPTGARIVVDFVDSLPPGRTQVRLDTDIRALVGATYDNRVVNGDTIDRIEFAPDGPIYLSCKIVGSEMNAFAYDPIRHELLNIPHEQDELAQAAPQVVYS